MKSNLLWMYFCSNIGTFEQRKILSWKSNQRAGKLGNPYICTFEEFWSWSSGKQALVRMMVVWDRGVSWGIQAEIGDCSKQSTCQIVFSGYFLKNWNSYGLIISIMFYQDCNCSWHLKSACEVEVNVQIHCLQVVDTITYDSRELLLALWDANCNPLIAKCCDVEMEKSIEDSCNISAGST